MSDILPVPPTLKPCQSYLKLASDHEKINPILTYWSRLYALQLGLKIDSKSKDNRAFLMSIMDWLEKEKKDKENDEKYTNEVIAQAYVENYGMKIFFKADEDDRAGNASKNTAKQFFTAAQVFDVSAVFGELSEELVQKSKYAKWRAAYIIKCIKAQEKPLPPEDETKADEEVKNKFSGPSNYNMHSGEQKIDEERQDLNIGEPAAAPNYNDFNFNQINNLKINDKKPSSATFGHSVTTDFSIKSDYPSDATTTSSDFTLAAINGAKISQDDILKAQKYSKWAWSALDYEDIKTAVVNLQKALNILTIGRENQ